VVSSIEPTVTFRLGIWQLQPARPETTPEVWRLLDQCLRSARLKGYVPPDLTVADIRRFVEVEHDPIWIERADRSRTQREMLWLPLTSEGNEQSPSGRYIAVPLDGSDDCDGALVN
jgi:hypothetical protein